MAISNRKIILSVCILIPFIFLSHIKKCHKDLCKGFINEKSFVLGESTIKDIHKKKMKFLENITSIFIP